MFLLYSFKIDLNNNPQIKKSSKLKMNPNMSHQIWQKHNYLSYIILFESFYIDNCNQLDWIFTFYLSNSMMCLKNMLYLFFCMQVQVQKESLPLCVMRKQHSPLWWKATAQDYTYDFTGLYGVHLISMFWEANTLKLRMNTQHS